MDKKVKKATRKKPALQAQLEEMRERMLRHAAEAENLRRRHAQELAKERKYAAANLAAAMLPVADNLQRAIINMRGKLVEPHRLGIQAVLQELRNAFANFNITAIKAEPGQEFDPNLHHAVSEQTDDKIKKGAILAVVQPGYMVEDRLLRPAMVIISGGR